MEMTHEEKQKRITEITSELERLQLDYEVLLTRREQLAAELRQLQQTRNRLRQLRRAHPPATPAGGTQFNAKS